MASRPMLSPQQVIINGDMSGNVTSLVTVIQNTSKISYDISWTGAPTGTFAVQVSNTYAQNADGTVKTPGNWNSITLSTVPAATGTPDTAAIDVETSSFYAIRLVYTFTSGTGTLQATVAGKSA